MALTQQRIPPSSHPYAVNLASSSSRITQPHSRSSSLAQTSTAPVTYYPNLHHQASMSMSGVAAALPQQQPVASTSQSSLNGVVPVAGSLSERGPNVEGQKQAKGDRNQSQQQQQVQQQQQQQQQQVRKEEPRKVRFSVGTKYAVSDSSLIVARFVLTIGELNWQVQDVIGEGAYGVVA